MAKILLVGGHGYKDPGAVGNGYNERDFIREHIVDTVAKYLKLAGHTVHVYGKSQDMYQDTRYGLNRGDTKNYGIFWAKSQGYDVVVEFHLDASTNTTVDGGHVIIGAGLTPDAIDIGIQNAIAKHVDVLHGISKRDDLAHTKIAKQIGLNYRLVELGFITNKGDMDYIVKHGDAFCKDIADAINMKEIIVSKPKAKAPAKKKATRSAKPSSSKASKSSHTVKPDETLWGIAQKYNISVDKLKSLNGLKSNVIHVGDKLKVKAVSSTSVKQKSAVKATAQNVRNKRTKAEAVAYAKSLEGKGLDFDNFAGWQCFDTANFYWNYMYGHGLKGVGAKDIPTWNDFTGEATIHKNTPEFLAEPGDLVVWGGTYGNGYGHVAVAIAATLNSITVVEQNWLNGGANKTERTTKRVHSYDTNMWFIRPIFK